MTVFDLYSKRKKREKGEAPDVFSYDDIPTPLRVQIVHIWNDAFGDYSGRVSHATRVWKELHDALAREFGLFVLEEHEYNLRSAVANYFISTSQNDQALDMIELSFQFINHYGNDRDYVYYSRPLVNPARAIEELNQRFLEHGIGFAFESDRLIRKDSELLHRTVVLPALQLLNAQKYQGANAEYLCAHDHYRHGRHKECLNECLKTFESLMKIICKGRGWPYAETDTAKSLIDVCFQHKLIPAFMQSQMGALRTCLESGIPTLRNKLGGHGQGASVKDVPQYFASYLLNLTAANIVFLVEADKHMT